MREAQARLRARVGEKQKSEARSQESEEKKILSMRFQPYHSEFWILLFSPSPSTLFFSCAASYNSAPFFFLGQFKYRCRTVSAAWDSLT
jgi:hypothetical protein